MRHYFVFDRSGLTVSWFIVFVMLIGFNAAFARQGDGPRRSPESKFTWSLDGKWQVSLDGGKSFQEVVVPSPLEDQVDPKFDGISIYRRSIENPPVPAEHRLWLHFDAVATRATVKLNGQVVGRHLGGWTSFACDITKVAVEAQKELKLEVEVDELVGHNTQGFLPVLIPHFGGIWQSVRLEARPELAMVGSAVMAVGDAMRQELSLEVPIIGAQNPAELTLDCQLVPLPLTVGANTENKSEESKTGEPAMVTRLTGSEHWSDELMTSPALGGNSHRLGRLHKVWTLPKVLAWSPQTPQLYELQLVLKRNEQVVDQRTVRCAFRTMTTAGHRLQLNGQTLNVRGLLNWGYAPPSYAPSLDEQWMRSEIEFAKSRGFNLMKFCLWIPPKRYLELCDELGMLAWMEYPTWHPKLDQQHLPDLQIEYEEFYQLDRNHPSVILRSLTCETGPSADIEVIRDLYNRCKKAVPGALVEDDSSWISWNRVHDFYDDHPYGNNHTWVSTLAKLTDYIAEREAKPLVLGEAIAADTWWDPDAKPVADQEGRMPSRPVWLDQDSPHAPWFKDSNRQWQQQMTQLATKHQLFFSSSQLTSSSFRYAHLMRKFQIETYRRQVPWGGYVISVIRDFPKASMGLVDFAGQPKTSPEDWHFQRDAMVILETPNDRRSFDAGIPLALKFHLRHAGPGLIDRGELSVKVISRDGKKTFDELTVHGTPIVSADTISEAVAMDLAKISVDQPTPIVIEATWRVDRMSVKNEWPAWIIPPSDTATPMTSVNRLDLELLDRLAEGQSVWLEPNGESGSFPISQHWFLRGAPVALTPSSWEAAQAEVWHLLIAELQHFDLAGPVVPHMGHYVDRVIPKVLLWDNHDMQETRTHTVAMEIPVGRGRLLVTTVNRESPAGRWVLNQWLRDLANRQPSDSELGSENLASLRRELNQRGLALHTKQWKFQPDSERQGIALGWHTSEFEANGWGEIRADRHWEGQGHAALDGWAWYRLEIEVPADWTSKTYFLNLGGVDDHCEIYVDGDLVGSMGDIENRKTAFDQPRSFDISKWVEPGKKLQLAIQVYDWFGAGGLFKPMTLSTEPTSESPPWLK